MLEISANQITSLFGQDLDDEAIQKLFEQLHTLNRPSIDPDDYDDPDDFSRYFDWVLVQRKGIELGFSEFYYHKTDDFDLWGVGDLLLTQAYFYANSEDSDISGFIGELPYQLLFTDTREIARQKLNQFENTRHSYLSDSWDVEGYRLNIQYTAHDTIDRIACIQQPVMLKHNNKIINPEISKIISCLGLSSSNKEFIELWISDDEFELEQEISINKYRQLDLRQTYGVYLSFSGKNHIALFTSITFYAPRENGSIGWYGELPFNLTFDDDFTTLISKVSSAPINGDDDTMTSQFMWNLPQYILHILYSNISNRILHISLLQRGS